MFKKNFIYITVIFLGILDQLSGLLLFAIPIKAIKLVDNGVVRPGIAEKFSIININLDSNTDQFLVFSALIIFMLIGVFILDIIKNELVKKIKIRSIKKIFKSENRKNCSEEYINKKLKKIDDFINFRTTLLYSLILLIGLFYYDYLLTMIIIFNCGLNYFFTKKFKSSSNSTGKDNNSNQADYIIKKIKNNKDLEKFIKPSISTFTMICIMTSVLLRENITISFILIFLIRLYLNKINDLITKITQNPNFKKSIINQIKFNRINN